MRATGAVLALVLAAGCTPVRRDPPPAAPPPATTPPFVSPSPPALPTDSVPHVCPTPRGTPRGYPAGVPADFPWPPGATVTKVDRRDGGGLTVRLDVPMQMPEVPPFLVRELRERGYALGRGDASPSEVNAPFSKGAVRGLVRAFRTTDQCESLWLVLIVRGAASSSPSG